MNLSQISDQVLLLNAKALASQERDVVTKILHHLREIETRRLFCDLKYQSLFDYAVHELKYSEGQASRRIQAMRAMVAVPEIESKMASGELSVSNAAMVQTAFIKSGKKMNRRDMLKKVEGLTTRQAQAVVGVPKKEITLDMIGDDVLRAKLKRIVGKYAHTASTLEGVLHLLADRDLSAPVSSQVQRNATPASESNVGLATNRKRILAKADKCSGCGSHYALQIDHIVPRALGGSDSPSNLRLLCRSCNQRSAIRHFGVAKMSHYLGPSS
jgi:5-methylcytosine-specific restriction endonuclease McrA